MRLLPLWFAAFYWVFFPVNIHSLDMYVKSVLNWKKATIKGLEELPVRLHCLSYSSSGQMKVLLENNWETEEVENHQILDGPQLYNFEQVRGVHRLSLGGPWVWVDTIQALGHNIIQKLNKTTCVVSTLSIVANHRRALSPWTQYQIRHFRAFSHLKVRTKVRTKVHVLIHFILKESFGLTLQ